ncbi:hypothetical protein ISF6_2729 [Piscinibacter sakaiensis]|uniref:Uncharacterized protein n=1 Tax=Piscinibacter sakaiensis TaxID=1547922 RepID=A0A0K8P2Y8_PISS1|nr:hypothetical protein ISF6_2729 [Piscinibacter sakaiensis]
MLLLLLAAAVLAAAWSQRTLVSMLRSAEAEAQAVRAGEAAQAGLAWGQALLQGSEALDADCAPPSANAAGAGSGDMRAVPAQVIADALAGAGAAPLEAGCHHTAGAWVCRCPRRAPAAEPPGRAVAPEPLPAADDGPAFRVRWEAAGAPGRLRLLATGCSRARPPCTAAAETAGTGTGTDAGRPASRDGAGLATAQVLLVRLPVLRRPPGAALTARGRVDAAAAGLGLHNADAGSLGLAAQLGGRLEATARVSTLPGGRPEGALVEADAALAATDEADFYTDHLGSDLADWAALPGVRRLTRTDDAARTLAGWLNGAGGAVRVAAAGELRLEGPLQLGTPAAPLVLVVDGPLHLRGAVRVHGLLVARTLRWDDARPDDGAGVRGAVLLGGDWLGDAAPDLVRDDRLLQELASRAGPWVRMPGSWREP